MRFAIAILTAVLAAGCLSPATIREDLIEAQAVLSDVAEIYRVSDPELAAKLDILAGDVGAVLASDDGGDLVQAILEATADVVWSDDPETQAHVAAAMVLVRAALRRAG